ncbi:MAG: hypothetical protein HY895_15535 [Deltaproteobacteria bacterium]|nr:hypothetical protein [Deltaproteobacteria bacterium]
MKKKSLSMIVILSVLALATGFGFAGGPAPEQTPAQAAKDQPVVIKGKVAYSERVDQFLVNGEGPPAQLMVVNPNPKLLGQLSKSGKTVTIQGRLAGGADLLFIEKIDGKPYRGGPAAK